MRRSILIALALAALSCGGHTSGVVDVSMMCNLGSQAAVTVLLHETSREPDAELRAMFGPRLCGTPLRGPSVASASALSNVGRRADSMMLFAPFAPNGIPLQESADGGRFGYMINDKRLADCGTNAPFVLRSTNPDFQTTVLPPPVIKITAPHCPSGYCGPFDSSRPLDLRWQPTPGDNGFVSVHITTYGPGDKIEPLIACDVPAHAGAATFPIPNSQGKKVHVQLSAQSSRTEQHGKWWLVLSALGDNQTLKFEP